MTFDADELKARRKAKGLETRRELMLALLKAGADVTERTIVRWEQEGAKPQTEHLLALARVLDCELSDLLTEKDEKATEAA